MTIELGQFPRVDQSVQCSWAPIYIEPIMGSGERLTIGVVGANMEAFYLARANRLDRLKCLFDDANDAAIFAAEASLDAFEALLAEQGLQAMKEPPWLFDSVSLGGIQHVRGSSVRDVAITWLAFSSCLHQPAAATNDSLLALTAGQPIATMREDLEPVRDRLPKLVFDYVIARRSGLSKAFRQVGAEPKPRRRSHEVSIDFYGSALVANIGTLVAGGIGTSVERIKRKMWDLKVARDLNQSPLLQLHHEMLVQRPANDDPQLTQRQLDNLQLAVEDLEKQADTEQIRFRPLQSVGQIGEHILQAEAA
jgi:hypothetical protein